MNFTKEQQNELRGALSAILKALAQHLESKALTTASDFEKAITISLEEAYDKLAGPPVDAEIIRDVASRLAKLANRSAR